MKSCFTLLFSDEFKINRRGTSANTKQKQKDFKGESSAKSHLPNIWRIAQTGHDRTRQVDICQGFCGSNPPALYLLVYLKLSDNLEAFIWRINRDLKLAILILDHRHVTMGFYKKGFFHGLFYSLFVYLNRLGAFSHTCYEQKGPVFSLDCVILTVFTPSVSNKNI